MFWYRLHPGYWLGNPERAAPRENAGDGYAVVNPTGQGWTIVSPNAHGNQIVAHDVAAFEAAVDRAEQPARGGRDTATHTPVRGGTTVR